LPWRYSPEKPEKGIFEHRKKKRSKKGRSFRSALKKGWITHLKKKGETEGDNKSNLGEGTRFGKAHSRAGEKRAYSLQTYRSQKVQLLKKSRFPLGDSKWAARGQPKLSFRGRKSRDLLRRKVERGVLSDVVSEIRKAELHHGYLIFPREGKGPPPLDIGGENKREGKARMSRGS